MPEAKKEETATALRTAISAERYGGIDSAWVAGDISNDSKLLNIKRSDVKTFNVRNMVLDMAINPLL